MYPPLKSGLTVKELPLGHLNLSPEKELPNCDDLQVLACAAGIEKKIELASNNKVGINILMRIEKQYSLISTSQVL